MSELWALLETLLILSQRRGELCTKLESFESAVTSADWLPGGDTFIVSTQDVNHALELYSTTYSKPIYTWSKPGTKLRVNDCSVSAQGDRVAIATTNNQIITYDLETKEMVADWELGYRLHGISYSNDGQSLLVSVQGIGPILLNSHTGMVQKVYTGCPSHETVIRAKFGGANQNFVISGSEKHLVHIWRRQTGHQVAALHASAGTVVSAVAWHPVDPAIIATAGDDRLIKM